MLLTFILTCGVSINSITPSQAQVVKVSPIPSVRKARLKQLLEQLRTANRQQRSRIIQEIKRMGPSSVPQLVTALDSSDPFVLSAAAQSLGHFGDDAAPAIPALLKLLNNQQRWLLPNTELPRIFPVPRLRPRTIRPKPLPPKDIGIQRRPSRRLRRQPRITAKPRLRPVKPSPVPIAKPTYYWPPRNPEQFVRVTAAATLGNIGATQRNTVQPQLQKALTDRSPWMQLTAAWALNHIGADIPTWPTYLALLEHPNAAVRQATSYTLTNPRSLTRKLIGTTTDSQIIEQFIQRLDDPDITVRDQSRNIIRKFGDQAIPALTQQLAGGSPLLKLQAIRSLGSLKASNPDTITELIAALADRRQYQPPPERFSKLPALPQLQPMRRPSHWRRSNLRRRPRLARNQLIRVEAALALGGLKPKLTPKLRQALLTGFSDDAATMRLASAWAILQLRSNSFDRRNAARILAGLMNIPDQQIASEARTLLQAIGPPAAPYLTTYWRNQLKATPSRQQATAILALGRLGPAALPAVPDLRTFLTSQNKTLRGYSATVLGNIARSLSRQSLRGNLPATDRERSIIELQQVLDIMEKPGAKFNRGPLKRVQRSLRILENNRPNYAPLQRT
ncbi:HEAT repeat domain-containing protein [filamentous cyanobacterium LEGE 11480]|uniref:HEAT repeat domain-containing protein n=2 Tax=Romeriopsis TaxID=2992131 RepID=A0A928Z4N0_9CYAN|nr:HEAT repeat domain-containing protein [Romeriopsis navalis LEGE 11480]